MPNQPMTTPTTMENLIAKLPNTPLLHEFATCYLQANSTKSLQNYSIEQFVAFITDRFEFFSESIKVGQGLRLYTIDSSSEFMGTRRVLEYTYPDAMHMVMTFNEIFKEFGCKITKMLHPIMTVEIDNNQTIKSIIPPQVSTYLISTTYIEFEGIDGDAQVEQFMARITSHMHALQSAQTAQKQLSVQLESIKTKIKINPKNIAEPKEEWINLIDWLQLDNFSFFGFAEIRHDSPPQLLNGLGILSADHLAISPHIGSVLTAHSWRMRSTTSPYVFDTIPVNSPIQRFEHLMRLSFKIAENDKIVDYNFVGVLKRSSLLAKNLETPIIHLKMKHIFESKRMLPGSFDHSEVIRIFTSIPKFELFRSSTDDLLFIVESILSITNPSDIYCFHRDTTSVGRTLLLVTIPDHLYTRTNVDVIQDYLINHVPHSQFELVEINGPDHNRLHCYFEQSDTTSWRADESLMQSELRERIKPWEERFKDAIQSEFPGQSAQRLYAHYIGAFPDHHKVRRTPAETVRDVLYLEKVVHEDAIQFDISPVNTLNSSLKGKASMLCIYNRQKIDLINIMPILQNLGVYVFDELTTRVGTTETLFGYIHSFRLANLDGSKIDEKRLKGLLTSLLTEIFEGRTENDRLNALALCAELNWRAINVLQLYRNLYLQLGQPHSKDKVNTVLLAHIPVTQKLFQFFETKFSVDPQFGKKEYRTDILIPKITSEFKETLNQVKDVSDDTILRQIFNLIEATLRTNFYIPKNNRDTFISVKIESSTVSYMPAPVPYREIYVHDVGFEGAHLRFGPIARGGLRWSDRHDDFRKEVLGLVKTQQTKNVVIVPVGSKGGFVLNRTITSKEHAATESVAQYKKFISAMLDLTDNIDGNGSIKHPHHVIAYDQTDPYLVVAADKGTASFSDIANEISDKYEFWLGDAFASGGSIGYNHKKEAITARGGWECVKLHFLEMGKNIEKETFTAVGIGDMSGDVFGNGMLLSKNIQLRAAFNHVHIFVDPNPNAETSWIERKRLFDLPRSAWTDYSPTLISTGGGVFERKAKEIKVTPEMADCLGIKEAAVTGETLIQYILKAKVDLVWLGGIGTYFKATHQNHASVGDPTNDSVRIDISQCRASVIGEGANLGVTQPARIEFGLSGGRINTDAIDNSAGVNMSDYEVNIKILLKQLTEEKVITTNDERNELLNAATNQVSELVLANNRGQHRLLSMDSIRSKQQLGIFIKLIQSYSSTGFLDAKTEQIPEISDLEQLAIAGTALPRPILATIQAYAKMNTYDRLMDSDVLDHPYFTGFYEGYFPQIIREKVAGKMPKHRLQRNILSTILTNKIINQAGILFFFQMEQMTGRSIPQIAITYYLLDTTLGTQELRQNILEEPIADADKYLALIEIEHFLAERTQALLLLPGSTISLDSASAIQKLRSEIIPSITISKSGVNKWKSRGMSEKNAKQLVSLDGLDSVTDILYLQTKVAMYECHQIIDLIESINAKFELKWIESSIHLIDPKSQWELSHKGILLQTITLQKFAIIKKIAELKIVKKSQIDDALVKIKHTHQLEIALYFDTLAELKVSRNISLTTLTVLVNRLGFLSA